MKLHLALPHNSVLAKEGKRRTRCGKRVSERSIAIAADEATCQSCRRSR